jgi:serine-type D-Ala-D-Ala carboxypeptidase/endopeptidase
MVTDLLGRAGLFATLVVLTACASPRAGSSPPSATATEPATASSEASPFPPDAAVWQMLADRIGSDAASYGIVVGLVEPGARRVIAHGSRAVGHATRIDGDTVFEIGSITKVFTSLLLADAVERQEVSLDDPVARYLPAAVQVPSRGGRTITLVDLATHTSGLPRLPNNMSPADADNPYADYSVDQLYRFLSSLELQRDIGVEYEYSNFGVGLLGHALTQKAGRDYESLVRERVTQPLGMRSTAVLLSPELSARLAQGHDESLAPAKNWDIPTLAGAGALRSTTNDLLTFLAAASGQVATPLAPAFARMHAVQRSMGNEGGVIELGWHVASAHGKDIVWHNGGTGGYRAFMGYERKTRVGVVVLTNLSTRAGPDDIALHLLDAERPLLSRDTPGVGPRQHRREVAVDPSVFDGYVGRFQLPNAGTFRVTKTGDGLFVQLAAQPSFQVFPTSETEYFYKVVDAALTFERDAQGKATALVLHQNGRDQRAPRVSDDPPTIALDPAVFDRYVGRYQLGPQTTLTFARREGRFFMQMSGQPEFEIKATGPQKFFLLAIDAQVEFEVDSAGRATAVVIHQGGRDHRGPRIE